MMREPASLDAAQVEDYARRKNMSVRQVENLLASNLNYQPS